MALDSFDIMSVISFSYRKRSLLVHCLLVIRAPLEPSTEKTLFVHTPWRPGIRVVNLYLLQPVGADGAADTQDEHRSWLLSPRGLLESSRPLRSASDSGCRTAKAR